MEPKEIIQQDKYTYKNTSTLIICIHLIQVSVWSNNYEMASREGGKHSEMEQLTEWLKTHIPQDQQPLGTHTHIHTHTRVLLYNIIVAIVHGDYRIDNVIFHQTEVSQLNPLSSFFHSPPPPPPPRLVS